MKTRIREKLMRGFTLIEVLLAMIVFLIGMAGVYSASVSSGRAMALANSKMTANTIGTNALELASVLSYQFGTTLQNGVWTTTYDRSGKIVSPSSAFFTAQASLVYDPNSVPASLVVSVSWTEPSSQENLQLTYQGPVPPMQ